MTMTIRHSAAIAMLALSATVLAAQHATVSAPGAYRTQFENDFVRVALKDGTLAGFQPAGVTPIAAGRERWLDAGQQLRLNNTGSAPAELLRIDFLTAPRK